MAFNPYSLCAPAGAALATFYPTVSIVTPQMYGAKGDGTTDDRGAFALVDSAASTLGSVYVPVGTYLINSNITLSGNYLFAPGAIIKPASGVIVTFSGSIESGPYQIFDLSASGSVVAGSAYKGLNIQVEWFGAGQGDATKDQTGFSGSIAFAEGCLHGSDILLESPSYSVSGGFTLSATTNGQVFRFVGKGPSGTVLTHTGNNVLFWFQGYPLSSPNNSLGSGVTGLTIVGNTGSSAVALQFSDSSQMGAENYRISGYENGNDIKIYNYNGFTEFVTLRDGYHSDSKNCFRFSRSANSGATNSFNGFYADNVICALGSVSGETILSFDQDGRTKTVYNAYLNLSCFASGAGNYNYIEATPSGSNSATNTFTGTVILRVDGLTVQNGTDGNVFQAYDKTSTSGGLGVFQDVTATITGANPFTLDLSTSSPPTVEPQYLQFCKGANGAGNPGSTTALQSICDVSGLTMTTQVPVLGGRAVYDWDQLLQTYSTYRLDYIGNLSPVASNFGGQSFLIQTFGPTQGIGVTALTSATAITGVSLSSPGNCTLRIAINGAGASGSDNGNLVFNLTRIK